MLTVQALREIYKALGGTETDITDNMTIPEALAKIAPCISNICYDCNHSRASGSYRSQQWRSSEGYRRQVGNRNR